MLVLTGTACNTLAKPEQSKSKAALDSGYQIYDTSDNPFITGKFGDPFPAYFDGVWHLYTLQSNLETVRHLTSRDLVNWTEHAPAMTGGEIATGMVMRHQGTYYLFYTMGQGAIGLVTSTTPWHFDRSNAKRIAGPDPHHYPDAKPFRDVSVFYNENEQLWWMLCEAHTSAKGVQVALLKAKELEGPWEPFSALYTQPRDGDKLNQFVSCPQLIQHEGDWYLTYLNNATSYHVADSPAGPWGKRKGQYNSDFLTAGSRSGTDGKRHLNWGFFTVRPTPDNPQARPSYGGPLGVGREMVFLEDKTIGVRPLPELITAIRAPEHNADVMARFKILTGTWDCDPEDEHIVSRDVNGGTALIYLPDDRPNYYLETDIEFGERRQAVSVTVRSTASQDSGYRIVLRPNDAIFEITEHTGQRRSFLTKPHEFDETAHLKIFVCDGQLEAFLDGRTDLSTRVQQTKNSKVILEASEKDVIFRNPLIHYFKQKTNARFRLELEQKEAVFSAEPRQTRMATCYQDRQGMFHLFADQMTDSKDSWSAEIGHYISRNLRDWTYSGITVPKGKGEEPDAYGAASPFVLATNGRVYLFYAGRTKPVSGKADVFAPRGEPGYVACQIMLASAKADKHGAPAEPFKKHGVVLAPGAGWNSMRLDDPCVVLDGDTVHLFYKGFDNNRKRDHVRAGYAKAQLSDMKFVEHGNPILAVEGGGEMPRVFRHNEQWHMFYHHFGGQGSAWRHHVAQMPRQWNLLDADFFAGHPTGGPRDIMMIYGMDGQLLKEPKMFVAGTKNGHNKLWLYRLVLTD
jgi:hypothetical protein